MYFIRITGIQFGSAIVLPVYSTEIPMTLSESLEVNLGVHTTSAFLQIPRLLSESLEVNLGVHTTCVFLQIPRLLSESLEVNVGVHTTSVFHRSSNDFYQNHWKLIWECILVYSSEFHGVYKNHWKSIWE